MFNCHECHLFEINTLWKSVLPQSNHPILIQNMRGKSFTFTASWMSCFPQHPGLSRLDRLVQNSLQKSTHIMVQCFIGPRFFWFDEFIKLSYFALLLNVWSMVNFRFQNILNRKLMNIFTSVPKTLDSSDHVHLNWNKQNSIRLTNSLAFSSRHK